MKQKKLQYWYHYVRTYIDSCFSKSLSGFFKGVCSNEIMNNYDFKHMNIFNKRPNCVLTLDKSPCCCNWAQGFNYTSVKLKQRGQMKIPLYSMLNCHFTMKQLWNSVNNDGNEADGLVKSWVSSIHLDSLKWWVVRIGGTR